MLVGREAEQAAIKRVLEQAREGTSAVLVLRGEAGIGKSALLDDAVAQATGFSVSRVAGIESEIGLGFAAVHQLLLPLLGDLACLPQPQLHALESVFGLAEHGPPDALLVFLAVLTLLDDAAGRQPMLLVIDDAQWLDQESARVMTFVARRLHADPIAMLFAIRASGAGGVGPFDALPSLDVHALTASDARELLGERVGGRVDVTVANRLIAETGGNPLALVEVASALDPAQLEGEVPLPEPLPAGRSLQDQFAASVRKLEPGARTLLLLAAAERFGDPALLHHAANAMGVDWDDAVEGIEAAGLATFDPRATFRHPLIRSAVYHDASSADRRAAHRALADALLDDDDVDRRVWHLAAAAAAPDEAIAQALERSASRVFRRGGTAAAAEFLERASEVTPGPVRRVDRLLEAVRLRGAAGEDSRAQYLLDSVLTRTRNDRQRAEAEWTQGLIWLDEGRGRDALRALARAVTAIEEDDRGFALEALITAEVAALYAGSLGEVGLQDAIANAALRLLPGDDAALTPAELLVRGVAIEISSGYLAAAPTLRSALDRIRQDAEEHGVTTVPTVQENVNLSMLLAVIVAVGLADDPALLAVTQSWVESQRRARTFTTLPIALDMTAVADVVAGRFSAAESAIGEAADILSFTGLGGMVGTAGIGMLYLGAFRGDEEQTRARVQRKCHDARERGSGVDIDQTHYVLAVLDLGGARYEAALEHCRSIGRDTLSLAIFVPPLFIEAAVRCDDLAGARAALDAFTPRAEAAGSHWALGLLESSRALLTDDDAEGHYREAIDHLSVCSAVFDRARVQLLYGEWLRRMRRRREARVELRAALEFFEGVEAASFGERTRRELNATGEHSRERSDDTRATLTAQEAQIARLVAEGRTNSDIASQLFISRSTVEYHLRKVFRKRGVTSRTQLARLELEG